MRIALRPLSSEPAGATPWRDEFGTDLGLGHFASVARGLLDVATLHQVWRLLLLEVESALHLVISGQETLPGLLEVLTISQPDLGVSKQIVS